LKKKFFFNLINLAQIPPTINITSSVTIELPENATNRTYSIPISIMGANTTVVSINQNGTMLNSIFNGYDITIPMMPNGNTSYVEVS
jgi:hypothetical protein